MNIGTICKRNVVSIDGVATLQEAAMLMRERHVGALVVTGPAPQGVRVAGIVTDRDLAIEAVAGGLDPTSAAVGELVNAKVLAVPAGASLSEAIEVMRRQGLRRLLVTGAEQQLVGIVTMDDLVQALAADLAGLAQVTRVGIEREAQRDSALAAPPARPSVQVPAEVMAEPWSG